MVSFTYCSNKNFSFLRKMSKENDMSQSFIFAWMLLCKILWKKSSLVKLGRQTWLLKKIWNPRARKRINEIFYLYKLTNPCNIIMLHLNRIPSSLPCWRLSSNWKEKLKIYANFTLIFFFMTSSRSLKNLLLLLLLLHVLMFIHILAAHGNI